MLRGRRTLPRGTWDQHELMCLALGPGIAILSASSHNDTQNLRIRQKKKMKIMVYSPLYLFLCFSLIFLYFISLLLPKFSLICCKICVIIRMVSVSVV